MASPSLGEIARAQGDSGSARRLCCCLVVDGARRAMRATYQRELEKSLAAICDGDESPDRMDDAIALTVILVGGIALARAVPEPEFSERILRVAREAAATYADHQGD